MALITGVQRFVGSNPHHIGIYFGVSPEFAFVDIWVGAYYCPFSFDCWVMVDLRQVMDIAKVELFTNEAFTSEFYNYGSGVNTSLVVFPVTDYRILVSNNNLDWTLAAVVTDQPATTRTDTITLEDLGGGMDIDINYVVALFLAIIFLGFFRQIFF